MSLPASLGPLLADTSGDFWFPAAATSQALAVDSVYYFIYWICVIFFVAIIVAMVAFAIVYRRRSPTDLPVGPTHNTPVEVVWTIVPLLLVMIIFWKGFVGYLELTVPPQDALQIRVTGKKWAWSFAYENGARTYNSILVPADTPVRLVMSSDDVIHNFFIPDFRIKHDVVPGRFSSLWFNAPTAGEHQVFCAGYCGDGHSGMLANLVVLPKEEYAAKLAEEADIFKQIIRETNLPEGPELNLKVGAALYSNRGCAQCHSIDGTRKTGPSFKGSWDTQHKVIEDGSTKDVLVDDNYVRESILYPQQKVVVGYGPPSAMPTFKGQLSDKEIIALIEYIKSLK